MGQVGPLRHLPGVVDLTGHVCHVTDAFAPERGGVERVIEELAAEQVRRGRRVTVITKAVAGAPALEQRPDGVVIRRFTYALRPTPRTYLSMMRSSRSSAAAVRREQPPAVVHYHLTLSAQGPLAVFGDTIPSVYSFHGPWHAEFAAEIPHEQQASPLYRRYLAAQMALQKRLQRRLLDRVDRVIIHSEYSRGRLAELHPRRAAEAIRLGHGVDTERFRPGAIDRDLRRAWGVPDEAFAVLTVRRLARRMGLDMLIDAVARQPPFVHLLLAGNGPLRAELETQAAAAGLAARVHFLGFVPEAELPALYRAADLFVVPSRAEENFGLIVLEAAACATPVAATPVGALPEVLAAIDSPLLAAAATSSALAQTIAGALRDREKTAAHFREVVAPLVRRDFSWARVVDRLDRLYAELGVR